MSEELAKQLEIEMKRFLEDIESQNSNDRLQSLRNLFDKYLHLSTCDYMMDSHDLRQIISGAKTSFSNKPFPTKLLITTC